MKGIVILGSTGSIGTQTLDVIRHLKGEFRVVGLVAGSNWQLLKEQVEEFSPQVVLLDDPKAAHCLRNSVSNVEVLSGLDSVGRVVARGDVDLVVAAIVGSQGIMPTIEAISAGKDIAISNKEVFVAAGEYVTSLAREKGVRLIPIDSEQSAIYQCIIGADKEEISRVILTASGGPFLHCSDEELDRVSLSSSLNHPNWDMGIKNTIDSSTLMNKGLEVIEAYWLFGLSIDQIDVVVHPQSIVHSMVEFVDGSIMSQCSVPDMKLPIQYALCSPRRMQGQLEPFDFTSNPRFDFIMPDYQRFPWLKMAYDALRVGGSMPCYMNAANEELVATFSREEISWKEMAVFLQRLIDAHEPKYNLSINEILAVDLAAREDVKEAIKGVTV